MNANREQIAAGAAEYISREIVSNVPDSGLRIALTAAAFSFRNNPATLDRLLKSPAAAMLFPAGDDGTWAIDGPLNAIRESVTVNGPLTLTVPAIPLISREEKTLSFGPQDIDKLRCYIERAVNANG